MEDKKVIPDNPLDFIRSCVKKQKIYWTYHVNIRLKQRYISRNAILNAVDGYEIIEKYPDDKYLPSYLIYAEYEKHIFHILFAVDTQEENIRIITSYYPNPEKWDARLKKRR